MSVKSKLPLHWGRGGICGTIIPKRIKTILTGVKKLSAHATGYIGGKGVVLLYQKIIKTLLTGAKKLSAHV